MAQILLNLSIISAHFPLVKGSAPHSQSPYTSPEPPTTAIFWFAPNISGEAEEEKQIFFLWYIHPSQNTNECAQLLFPASLWGAQLVLPLPTLLWGVQAAQLGIFLTLLFSPHTAPDLVTSYHTEKAEFGQQEK